VSKKPRKTAGRCYCGTKLRPKDKHCRRCGRVTRAGMDASLRKAVATVRGPAFIGKSAAPAGAYCTGTLRHWTAAPRGGCCPRCGAPLEGVPVPSLSAVSKSAFADTFWSRQLANSPDPAMRNLYWTAKYGQSGDIWK
jgi:hypothetical protein